MEMEPGKLFIGGISWETNEGHLREYFQKFGEVMETVTMKDRKTGRARGFGFVVFTDPAVAEIVVRKKHIIDGRTVEAKKAVPRDDQHLLNRNKGSLQGSPGPARTKKVFVGGLASTVTESDFKKYFDQFGTITDIVVMYDHNTQRPRGFGFITYDSEEAVEKVLHKTFHELNSKMVEVKRAVPKELSPGPNRNLFGGYNNGLGRVSNFLNVIPSSVGGYGGKRDGRFSPVTIGLDGNRYPPFGPSGWMGLNSELELNPNNGGSRNFSSNIGCEQGRNPFYGGNPNRYNTRVRYNFSSSETGSVFSPTSLNMWEKGSLKYASNSANSSDLMGSGIGNTRLGGAFGSIGSIWDTDSTYSIGSMRHVNTANSFGSGLGDYGRNSRGSAAPTSSNVALNDGLDDFFGSFYGGGSFYGDSARRSSSPELEGSNSFAYGLGKVASDVTAKDSAGFVGGFTVTNRGIAA
ncbi:hypothetical protein U1Q18_008779 [Sarracenia purpurea var. burkii]